MRARHDAAGADERNLALQRGGECREHARCHFTDWSAGKSAGLIRVAQAFDAGSRDGRIGRDQAIDAMPADGVGDRLDFIAAEIRGHLDDERDRTSMALRELCPIAS